MSEEYEKEKVKIIIDKWYTEDDYEIYRITYTDGEAFTPSGNGGFIMYKANIDDFLDNYSNEYEFEIVEDYR